jgi:hypothetical protein
MTNKEIINELEPILKECDKLSRAHFDLEGLIRNLQRGICDHCESEENVRDDGYCEDCYYEMIHSSKGEKK